MDKKLSIEEEQVYLNLKGVIDPELMVNIVDLGLVYSVTISEPENLISIDLTLTSQGCPLGDVITENVQQTVLRYNPNHEVKVNLVWEPAWNLEMLTEEGKMALDQH